MKKRLRVCIPFLLSILLICSFSYYAIAVTDSGDTAGEPIDSYVDSIPSESIVEPEPAPEPEPEPEPDPTVPDSSYEPDYSDQTPSNDNNNYENNFSFVEPDPDSYSEPQDDGYVDYNSSNVVSDTSNELYDVSQAIDTNELDESDWKMALNFSNSRDGTSDFNFIKNNKSADDETAFQWMLYLGIAMIAGAIIGIISVIIVCTNKKKKLAVARARNNPVYTNKAPQKTIYTPQNKRVQKYDTAEIDIDLGKSRKGR